MSKFVIFFAFLGFFACKGADDNSAVKHDLGKFVLSPSPLLWQELSASEFDEVYIPANSWEGRDSFFADEHPATRRLNHLLRWIHQTLTDNFPEAFENVPMPRAKIYRGMTPDAFVTQVPVCYDLPVRFATNPEVQAAQQANRSDDYLTMTLDGEFSLPKGAEKTKICLHKKMTPKETREYFEWLNKEIARSEALLGRREGGCQFTLAQKGKNALELLPGAGCKRSSELDGIALARGLKILKTQPYIVFYAGLINHVDEEIKIVSTLAHELGHYYRNHVNPFAGDYGYFYRIEVGRNPDHKPPRESGLESRGADDS